LRIAPEGTEFVGQLGAGSVFEVAVVREIGDIGGRELIAKRVRGGLDVAAGARAMARESEVLRACSTPHLPSLVRVGIDAGGAYVLETRALGEPLRRYVPGGALDAPTWMVIAASASAALSSLHGLSDASGPLDVTHGDISPDNVVFAPRSQTTFVDLSSAVWRDGPAPASPRDRGTLPYSAPELARNESLATQASDTYALAAVLLTLAVGPICEATTSASRLLEIGTRGVLRDRIEEREDLPRRMRTAVTRALAFHPGARLASSADLTRAFEAEMPPQAR
jgi:serine/threonine protein kinase